MLTVVRAVQKCQDYSRLCFTLRLLQGWVGWTDFLFRVASLAK